MYYLLILSSISSSWQFWSVNHTSIYEKSELNVFKNLKFVYEISNNCPYTFFGTNIYKTWIILIIIVDNVIMN